MTNRRGFLHGLFGGVTTGGLLIAASPADVERFAAPLARDEPVVLDATPPSPLLPAVGEHLYNGAGELVAVVRSFAVHQGGVDIQAACVGILKYPSMRLRGALRRSD